MKNSDERDRVEWSAKGARRTVLDRKISIAELATETPLNHEQSSKRFEQTGDAQRSREFRTSSAHGSQFCVRDSRNDLQSPALHPQTERAWVKFQYGPCLVTERNTMLYMAR